MVIKMNEFGTSLCTRVSGRSAYDLIMDETGGLSVHTVFDFSGIEVVTNSFADEVFGRMAHDMGFKHLRSLTSFVNIDSFTARVVRRAIDARATEHDLTSV